MKRVSSYNNTSCRISAVYGPGRMRVSCKVFAPSGIYRVEAGESREGCPGVGEQSTAPPPARPRQPPLLSW